MKKQCFEVFIIKLYLKINKNEEVKKIYMSDLNKVVELFMKENDKQALEELYKRTDDKLAKILLNWKNEYEMELKDPNTWTRYMYDDIIEYIWEKYKLYEINKEENIDIEYQIKQKNSILEIVGNSRKLLKS